MIATATVIVIATVVVDPSAIIGNEERPAVLAISVSSLMILHVRVSDNERADVIAD